MARYKFYIVLYCILPRWPFILLFLICVFEVFCEFNTSIGSRRRITKYLHCFQKKV